MLKNGTYIADRYEVVGQIGTGGMSDVYKAKDHTLGRYVAIKVLKEEFSEDTNFVTKFRSEAQAAAGLEHPNIVNIYDVGSENGIHYIVMEYVEGITLKTYIEKKGQLNYKETLSIAIQVSRGIQAAHAKHIIHRDIKPQNIIISTDGKVKVTDFGIARAVSEHTIHSDVMGSVHYASPEQARNGYVSNRSDIYSLGIVMYEMVTGRVPFDGDSTVAVAIQHLQDEMVPPSTYAPNLPISLEKIIQKCTQKSPDRRYDSMESLLIDLRKALLNPNEDFVTLVPLNQDKTKTRVLTDDEVSQIRKQAETVNPEPEKKTMAQEVPEEDDEDYDNIILKSFDLALRKFIIAVSDDTKIENSEYLKNTEGTYKRAPVVDTSKLNTKDENGNCKSLITQPQMISAYRGSRPAPKDAAKEKQEFKADVIMIAVGQDIVSAPFEEFGIPAKWNILQAGLDTEVKEIPGVFTGGDCATGPSTVIRAIAAGKVAAHNIDEYLGYHHTLTCEAVVPEPKENMRDLMGRTEIGERPANIRKKDFEHVEELLTHEEAMQEACRCLRCDHFGCGAMVGGRDL